MPLLFAGLRLGEAMSGPPFVITEFHWQGPAGDIVKAEIDAVIRMDSGIKFKIEVRPHPTDPAQTAITIAPAKWPAGDGSYKTPAEKRAAAYLFEHAEGLLGVLQAAIEDESAHLPPGTVTGTIGSGIARFRVDEP